jgi:hypothetical protein
MGRRTICAAKESNSISVDSGPQHRKHSASVNGVRFSSRAMLGAPTVCLFVSSINAAGGRAGLCRSCRCDCRWNVAVGPDQCRPRSRGR